LPEIININSKKNDISENMVKEPISFFNHDYLGIARFKGRHKLHTHDMDELFLVMDGKLIIEVDDEVHTLEHGEAILIKKGEKHVSMCEDETHVLVFEPQGIKTAYIR